MQKLLNQLTRLPLSLRKEYESSISKRIRRMRAETQIDELFIHLNPLTSFIDYGLIDYFIKKFGSDALKKHMRSYRSEIVMFMKETTIKQLIDHLPGQTEIPPKFSLIETKIGQNASECTLEQLDKIRKRYCSEVKLSEIVFHLVAVVESNSFIVRWLVPSALVYDIVRSTRNVDQSFYWEYKITSLTLNGMWLYVSKEELEAMWLHVSSTKLIDRFHTMHKQIVLELEMNKTSTEELSQCLVNHHPKLQRDMSIILSKAIMDHCFVSSGSFFDFELLNSIIVQFGSNYLKRMMKSYCSYMSVFPEQSVMQLLVDLPSVGTKIDDEQCVKVECRIVKEPSKYTCDNIIGLKNSICAEIDIDSFAFSTNNIRNSISDSFSVSWLVPTTLAPGLIESASQISREFYIRNWIAGFSIGNKWVYNPQLFPFSAKLKERYQQSQGSPSPVEWIPSPTKKIFRLAMIQRERVQRGHIEDKLVQMTISGRVDDILHAKSPVELEHIFRNTLYGSEIILIEGAPGSGKSTLSVHICQRWGIGELFQQFTVVILVQLRDPAVQRAQTIADLLPVENDAVAQELATELVATNGRGVLWVLDGWDELPPQLQQDSIFRKLLSPKPNDKEQLKKIKKDPLYSNYVRQCTDIELWKVYLQNNPPYNRMLFEYSVLVTSRPISSGDLHPVVSSRIEVLGFTPEEQRQYFTECLKGDTKALKALLEKVQENPVVQSICYLPLNAAFVVHTFKYKGQSLPNTEYETYSSVILSCIQRHFERKGGGHRLLSKLASLDDLSRSKAVREPFQCLCELAYRGVMENKVTFSSSDLPQGSNTLSLLQAIESFLQGGKSVFYNFLHLSMQEILSAYYIATRLSDDEQVSRFQQLFNQPRFAAVFQFYAAITKLKSPGIRQVIEGIIKQRSRPLFVSLLRCLHEAQDPSLCHYVAERLDQDVIDKMEYVRLDLRDNSLSPLDCLSVSFFLSSSGRAIIVDFDKCCIGDLGAKSLAKYLDDSVDQAGKVTIYLLIDGNDIHEEGASHIARIINFIEHLDLSRNPIGDTGASPISEAASKAAMLKTLSLYECGITSKGAEDLSRTLAQNSSLKKLDIGWNNLGDEGISHLTEALKQNKHLKELWIGKCGMTDKGAASLASALSVNNSLKMLHIGGGKEALTEDGLSTITQPLANNSEFMELAIPKYLDSTAGHLRQKVNEIRKRNGLPPIRILGEYYILYSQKFSLYKNSAKPRYLVLQKYLVE